MRLPNSSFPCRHIPSLIIFQHWTLALAGPQYDFSSPVLCSSFPLLSLAFPFPMADQFIQLKFTPSHCILLRDFLSIILGSIPIYLTLLVPLQLSHHLSLLFRLVRFKPAQHEEHNLDLQRTLIGNVALSPATHYVKYFYLVFVVQLPTVSVFLILFLICILLGQQSSLSFFIWSGNCFVNYSNLASELVCSVHVQGVQWSHRFCTGTGFR